eukprot:SAG11_NODE_1061_length_6000_cov_10.931029_2_plen_436_part_00
MGLARAFAKLGFAIIEPIIEQACQCCGKYPRTALVMYSYAFHFFYLSGFLCAYLDRSALPFTASCQCFESGAGEISWRVGDMPAVKNYADGTAYETQLCLKDGDYTLRFGAGSEGGTPVIAIMGVLGPIAVPTAPHRRAQILNWFLGLGSPLPLGPIALADEGGEASFCLGDACSPRRPPPLSACTEADKPLLCYGQCSMMRQHGTACVQARVDRSCTGEKQDSCTEFGLGSPGVRTNQSEVWCPLGGGIETDGCDLSPYYNYLESDCEFKCMPCEFNTVTVVVTTAESICMDGSGIACLAIVDVVIPLLFYVLFYGLIVLLRAKLRKRALYVRPTSRVNVGARTASRSSLDSEPDSLNVGQLKRKLKERGLSTKGSKAILRQRLSHYLLRDATAEGVDTRPPPQATSAWSGSSPHRVHQLARRRCHLPMNPRRF